MGEERLYSVNETFIQKEFAGEVKRANKAAKRVEMMRNSSKMAIESGDVDRMVWSGRRRNLRWRHKNDPLVPGRSKVDRLKNLSYESRNKIFDKRREVLGRTGNGAEARLNTKYNLPGRPGTETGDVLANKGSKAERIARLSEKNQIRYHNNNAHRGQERIKFGESSASNITSNAQVTTVPTTTAQKIEMPSTNSATAKTVTSKSVTSSTGVTSKNMNATSTPTTTTSTPTTTTSTPKTTTSTPKTTPKPKVNKGSLFNGSFNPMKWSTGAKIGTGIAAGTALIGTGVYLHNKNKKKNNQ